MPVYDVVVVGGGNLGLWTAHRLARRGFGRVAVLERGWAGGGATSRSAGVVRQQGGSETAAKLGRLSRELYLRARGGARARLRFQGDGVLHRRRDRGGEGGLPAARGGAAGGRGRERVGRARGGQEAVPGPELGPFRRGDVHRGRRLRASAGGRPQRHLRGARSEERSTSSRCARCSASRSGAAATRSRRVRGRLRGGEGGGRGRAAGGARGRRRWSGWRCP